MDMRQKLDIGAILDEVFSAYVRHAPLLMPLAFIFFLPSAIVNHLPIAPLAVFPVAYCLQALISTLYQGLVAKMLSDVRDDRSRSVPQLIESMASVAFPLVVSGVLIGISVVFGMLLFIIPGLILLTIWAVVAPAIAVERIGAFAAFRRSRDLVRGNAVRVFVVILITGLVTYGVSLILNAVVEGTVAGEFARSALSAIAFTFTAPVNALVVGVLYFRLSNGVRSSDALGSSSTVKLMPPNSAMS